MGSWENKVVQRLLTVSDWQLKGNRWIGVRSEECLSQTRGDRRLAGLCTRGNYGARCSAGAGSSQEAIPTTSEASQVGAWHPIHLTSHHSLGVCDELECKSLVGSPPSTIWVLLSSSLYSVQGKEGDVRCGVQSAARETGFYRSEMKPDKRQG